MLADRTKSFAARTKNCRIGKKFCRRDKTAVLLWASAEKALEVADLVKFD